MSLKIEGHLTSKSSPLAPVSCKLTKQFMVQQHLNAHYKNISNVKSSIDNKCPKSWFKHVNVKDQLRKERLIKSARENCRDNQASVIYNNNKSFRSELDEDIIQSTNRTNLESMKPLGPRIYKNDVKSKVAQLRCYNAPKKRNVTSRPSTAPKLIATTNHTTLEEIPEKVEIKLDKNDVVTKEYSNYSEKDLRYLNFCNDVTNDILQNNIFTNRGINHIFNEHIARNKYHLKMDAMLKAYDTIKKELEGKIDLGRYDNIEVEEARKQDYYNYPMTDYKSYQSKLSYDSPRPLFPRSDSVLNDKVYLSDDDRIYDSYEDKDRRVINSLKTYDIIEHNEEESLDKISPKLLKHDFSAAPSALQWSLTSAEDCEPNTKTTSVNIPAQSVPNIDNLCQDIYDIQIKNDNQPPQIVEKTMTTVIENKESEDNNINKNVHFAKHNEVYSAPESEDHSLTDVTSMRMEASDDDNNDSTCVESSLDLNQTFKSEHAATKDLNDDDNKYEDDFDD